MRDSDPLAIGRKERGLAWGEVVWNILVCDSVREGATVITQGRVVWDETLIGSGKRFGPNCGIGRYVPSY